MLGVEGDEERRMVNEYIINIAFIMGVFHLYFVYSYGTIQLTKDY